MVEPELTRVIKAEVHNITDAQLMAVSGKVHVGITDIICSDHSLVWVELGRTAKNSKGMVG